MDDQTLHGGGLRLRAWPGAPPAVVSMVFPSYDYKEAGAQAGIDFFAASMQRRARVMSRAPTSP